MILFTVYSTTGVHLRSFPDRRIPGYVAPPSAKPGDVIDFFLARKRLEKKHCEVCKGDGDWWCGDVDIPPRACPKCEGTGKRYPKLHIASVNASYRKRHPELRVYEDT